MEIILFYKSKYIMFFKNILLGIRVGFIWMDLHGISLNVDGDG